MPPSSSLPIPRSKTRRVSFSDSIREHSFSADDSPIRVATSYEPPPTPQLKSKPLPGTPELALANLTIEDDQYVYVLTRTPASRARQ